MQVSIEACQFWRMHKHLHEWNLGANGSIIMWTLGILYCTCSCLLPCPHRQPARLCSNPHGLFPRPSEAIWKLLLGVEGFHPLAHDIKVAWAWQRKKKIVFFQGEPPSAFASASVSASTCASTYTSATGPADYTSTYTSTYLVLAAATATTSASALVLCICDCLWICPCLLPFAFLWQDLPLHPTLPVLPILVLPFLFVSSLSLPSSLSSSSSSSSFSS